MAGMMATLTTQVLAISWRIAPRGYGGRGPWRCHSRRFFEIATRSGRVGLQANHFPKTGHRSVDLAQAGMRNRATIPGVDKVRRSEAPANRRLPGRSWPCFASNCPRL